MTGKYIPHQGGRERARRMSRQEREAAITTLVAAIRVAYAAGIAGAQTVIQGPAGGSPGDSAVAKALVIMETVGTNTISAQQVTDLNADLALIQSGSGAMATALIDLKNAMDAANVGLCRPDNA